VQLGIGAVQGVHRPREVQGCKPEQGLKDSCCKWVQSRSIQALESVESCHKECEQEASFRELEAMRKAQEV
jgi:hypothetical protein